MAESGIDNSDRAPAQPAGPDGRRTRTRAKRPESAGSPGQGGQGQGGQGQQQGSDRQRLEPQDQPPADVLDDENIAGDKDFELRPGT